MRGRQHVNQGGIMSPIKFVIYGADMELWLKHSSALTYADDTSTKYAPTVTILLQFPYIK